MPEEAYFQIDNLLGGAVSKRFGEEWNKVLNNVYDLRTPATKPRSVTLTVTIAPNAARDVSNVKYSVTSKLATPEALQQTVLMRQRDDGSVQMREQTSQVPGQMDINGNEAPLPNVVEFKVPADGAK